MRAAVLGAGGTIAPAIIHDLVESDEVESLLLVDVDAERLEAVAATHGQASKVSTAVADAKDNLADVLAGVDVMVNSASYRINLEAMGAALEAGCNYIDLGGLYHVAAKQLELSPQFEAAGLIGILGMGSAPGKTNLMAAVAKRELGEVESMDVSAGGRDLDPPDGFSVPYAVRTLIDELTLAPIVLRGGEPVEVGALDDGGVVDFGEPIGPGETVYTLHSEMLTFGTSFGCSEGTFRLSLSPRVLERLRALTGAPDDEIDAAGREAVPPSGNTVSVHVIDAAGGGRSIRVRAVTEPMKAWGLGGGVVSTAAPAAAAVRLLARGAIEAKGVMPPERCIQPETMFAELEGRGCRFEIGPVVEESR